MGHGPIPAKGARGAYEECEKTNSDFFDLDDRDGALHRFWLSTDNVIRAALLADVEPVKLLRRLWQSIPT
ncbi:MAG: hypothetical protein U1E29_01150 [Coriobacteriia bacterium]|nr:hypothetical protein [Coriobacteriia bacterium]